MSGAAPGCLKVFSALALLFVFQALCVFLNPLGYLDASPLIDAVGSRASLAIYICSNLVSVILLSALVYRFLWFRKRKESE